MDRKGPPLAAVRKFAEALFPALTSLAAASRSDGDEARAVFYETGGDFSPVVLTQVDEGLSWLFWGLG